MKCIQWRSRGVYGCSLGGGGGASLGATDKNDHKIFASTLGKWIRTSVIVTYRGPENLQRATPKSRNW